MTILKLANKFGKIIFRLSKVVFVHSLTTFIFAPTFMSWWEDRPVREPFSYYILSWDDTLYSDGYSQAAFNAIKIGDDINEVNQKLGQPLITYTSENCIHCDEDGKHESTNFYSRSSRRSNYWYKVSVTYDNRSNRVVDKYIGADD